jgi:hypothetical protein
MGLFGACLASCSSDSSGSSNAPPRPPGVPAVTAKGEPAGAASQATIGAAGGKLASSDGVLTVIIPAGALAADTPISIQPITSVGPGAVGGSYRLTPEGQVFATPAQVVFTFTDAELTGSVLAALRIAYQDDKGQWRAPKSVARDAAAHTVSVPTMHFSDWSKVTGLKVTPPSASIQPGESVNLRLDECERKEDPSYPELSELLLTCVQVGASAVWSANGAPGGDNASGTVTEVSPGDAAYVAPNVTPPSNPVAVSAAVPQTDGSKIIVVSNITVGGHPSWTGTSRSDATITTGPSVTKTVIDATVRWTWNEADQAYHATGALVFDYNLNAGTCTTTAHYQGVISGQDGTLIVYEGASPGQLQYAGGGQSQADVMGTSTCNDSHTPEPAFISAGPTSWWMGPAPPDNLVSADGRTIAGSVKSPPGQEPVTDRQWSFTQE